jgi:hypothetical protein
MAELCVEDIAVSSGAYPIEIVDFLNARPRYPNPYGGPAYAGGPPASRPGVCYYEVFDGGRAYRITGLGKRGTVAVVIEDTLRQASTAAVGQTPGPVRADLQSPSGEP